MNNELRLLKLEDPANRTPLRRFHQAAVRAGDELDAALRQLPAHQQTTDVLDAVLAVDEALTRMRQAIIGAAIESGEAQWR